LKKHEMYFSQETTEKKLMIIKDYSKKGFSV
jgi:hypothetical protein